MARIRTIKPTIFSSATVCGWPVSVRWTFVGLFTYMDDAGRGRDDARLIKAELYPLDDQIGARRIGQHLDLIEKEGPLCRYLFDGARYMHIVTWREHQKINRPSRSTIPPCPTHEPDGLFDPQEGAF